MISSPVGRLISSGPMPAGGFTLGMVLAGRYRIIGLLGPLAYSSSSLVRRMATSCAA
jgi:hypothetical protein